jgi:OmpA-OmpF porin, OOP family
MKCFPVIAAAWFALGLSVVSVAQAQDQKIFDEKQLNEAALIDALTPNARPSGARTRSLRTETPPQNSAQQADSGKSGGGSAGVMVTFATGSSTLTSTAKSALDVVARALSSDQLATFRFAVEGHADRRGNPESNLALSQSRADAVVAYLVDAHKISPDRLKAVGRGDAFPARPDPAARENRRVMFVTQVEEKNNR